MTNDQPKPTTYQFGDFRVIKRKNFEHIREGISEHIRRVDSATKLTQGQTDSQLKRAKKVLVAFDSFLAELDNYSGYVIDGD